MHLGFTFLAVRCRDYCFSHGIFVCVVIACLLVSGKVLAEQAPSSDSSDETEGFVGKTLDAVVGQMENAHDVISGGLEASARSIDRFFAEDAVFEESTETYLRIGLDTVAREYEGLGYASEAKIKLDLPHTRKRLKLLIESDPQRGETEDLKDRPADVAERRDYSVSLEKEVSWLDQWNVRPSLGIKLHTPVDLFFRVRSHRYISYDKWLLRISSGVGWFDQSGYEGGVALELDRSLTQNLLFRYGSGFGWKEEEMFRRINQGLSIYQEIDKRQKMAYQILAQADDASDGWQAKRYDILIRYRRALYKQWMFAEIIPQWIFIKETGFHSQGVVTFRLEMVFGKHLGR